MEKLKTILIALLLLSAYTLVSEMDYQDQVRHHQNQVSKQEIRQ